MKYDSSVANEGARVPIAGKEKDIQQPGDHRLPAQMTGVCGLDIVSKETKSLPLQEAVTEQRSKYPKLPPICFILAETQFQHLHNFQF